MFRNSVSTLPTEVLPDINTLVKVTITTPPAIMTAPASRTAPEPRRLVQLPSRVEDVDPAAHTTGRRTLLYVAVPRFAGDLEGPQPGSPCRVIWHSPLGMYELPTRYQGRTLVGPAVRAWRLVVDGPVVRVQRRRYFRVPWVGPVTLEVAADEGTEPVAADEERLQVLTGMSVDLSEGGLRVALPPPGLRDGTAIRVLLPVRDRVLVLPATTVWNRPAPAPVSRHTRARQVEIGISFDNVEEHGDFLRRVVTEAQLRARRAGLA